MSLFQIPSGLPTRVTEALEDLNEVLVQQRHQVDSVTVLPNVCVDMDRTLEYRYLCKDFDKLHVLRGVVVSVKGRYKLDYQDAIWMPKDLGRGRSIFDANDVDKSALEDVKLGDLNDSVTINRTLEIDDMGNVKENALLVVDTGLESLNSWDFLDGSHTINSLMEEWQQNEGVINMDKRMSIAKEVGSDSLVYEDTTCALYHDGTYVYVANCAVKNDDEMDKVLFRHSSLGGFRLKELSNDTRPFIQSDYGLSDKTYGYADLDDRTVKRLKNNYHWKGGCEFNTYVLRPPSAKSTDKPGEILRTEFGYFSANDVSHMMDSADILHIAPPNASITVPIDMEHALFHMIVLKHKEMDKVGFHIFSEAHTGDSIKVPVSVIKSL